MDGRDVARAAALSEEPFEAAEHAAVAEHIRAGLDSRLRVLVARDQGTRIGEDPEELHQMRVSVRRIRAMLKSGRAFLDPDWTQPLLEELGWLGRQLGAVRDLDVLLERLRKSTADLEGTERAAAALLISGLEFDHVAARREMLSALDSDRYFALISILGDSVRRPLPTRESSVDETSELISLVGNQFRKLRKDVERIGTAPEDARLHALRIRGKRLRYTAELAVPVSGKPMKKLVESTKNFQDVLGEHQDACVAADRVRELLSGLGERADIGVAFAAGRLVEREGARRAACRDRWWSSWEQVRASAEKLWPEQQSR